MIIGSPETRVFILVALARVNMTHWFNIQPILTPKIPIIGISENTSKIPIIGSLGSIEPRALFFANW